MRAQKNPATARRNKQLAAIHIGAEQLGLDRESYEAMLWTVARVRSARDLDEAGRERVLEHMRARGFRGQRHPGRPHNTDRSPQIRKIEALLAAASRPWKYADAMAQRMFKVDRVAFCQPDQLRKLIAALTYDARRRLSALPEGAASASDARSPDADQSESDAHGKTPTAGGDVSLPRVHPTSRGQHPFEADEDGRE